MKALEKQVGGNHYKGFQMQPIELIEKLNLSFLQGCVIKRICRYNQPGGKGKEDLNKILHELDLIWEFNDYALKDDAENILRHLCMFIVVNALTTFQRRFIYDFIDILVNEDDVASYIVIFERLKANIEEQIDDVS